MSIGFGRLRAFSRQAVRWQSRCENGRTFNCQLLMVGGGTGGCSTAWRLSRRLKKNSIILLEPCDIHYYQPGFTLVGSGITEMHRIYKPLASMLPSGITWLRDRAEAFDPCNNTVYTTDGKKIVYDFMVVAVGVKNDYNKIKGLQQALDDPKCPVSTIYSSSYCTKTWRNIKKFKGGHAIFTNPSVPGKCPGAALKIMYLADAYWRKRRIRKKSNITFNTASPTIFGIPKYAAALTEVTSNRDIVVNHCVDLVEVTPTCAAFVDSAGKIIHFPYNMLHVTPLMSPPACLSKCQALVNEAGFLDVDQYTLQHKSFSNVFGLGDCTCTPNGKTAAAVGPQSRVLEYNLYQAMAGKCLHAKYNGYGACPMLTSYNKGILAEFLYDKKIWETFPFDQAKERRILYQLNTKIIPIVYWYFLMKGRYDGPVKLRKFFKPTKK